MVYAIEWKWQSNRKHEDYVYVNGKYQGTFKKNKALFETWKIR